MMRASGTVDELSGVGLHDHVCWAYDDPTSFRHSAVECLAGGIALGARVEYVASGSVAALCDDLDALDDIESLVSGDALRVSSLDATYRGEATPVDPEAQVAAYARATRAALDAGFTGLRVVAEATPLVRTAQQRDAFARYEVLVDRYMTGHPFSAVCAYRRSELGSEALAEIACVHPLATEHAAPFQIFTDGPTVVLVGEVDVWSSGLFERALARIDKPSRANEVVVDGSRLTFVDHRFLVALDAFAARHEVTVVITQVTHLPVARMIAILALTRVRATPSPAP